MSATILYMDAPLPKRSSFWRHSLRLTWSVFCFFVGALVLEKASIFWPNLSSVTLPLFFVAILATLYLGHKLIDISVDALSKRYVEYHNDGYSRYFTMALANDLRASCDYQSVPTAKIGGPVVGDSLSPNPNTDYQTWMIAA